MQAALARYDGIETFYCMPKMLKNKIPVPLWPFVATINTPMYAIGKLIALWLKPITKKVSAFIRESYYLTQKPHQLGKIKSDDYLFTADAVSMHKNIDTEENIAAILLSFELNIVKYDTENTPTPQVISVSSSSRLRSPRHHANIWNSNIFT